MRWRIPLITVLALFVAVSCDQQPVEPQTDQVTEAQFNAFPGNPVIQRVIAGSPDGCAVPGCDGNFSLNARRYYDGTVTGQWQDAFGDGYGAHIDVDCLTVVGNEAWVSGIITHSRYDFLVGTGGFTRVADNGQNANDPADQISFLWFYEFFPPGPIADYTCGDTPDVALFDILGGQVIVK